ncbi:MAG TPA: ABC transporter ATP-binding protein [Candidatus Manganitrophaceae bacterium]|nr:ABC transporter ATP-binding protein [Candidatus Manganitrophaceae bacterium]
MIELNEIAKVYPHPVHPVTALSKINLTVRKGSFSLLMGPSGCGKSTLLNLIGGLDQPTSGELTIAGRSTRRFSDADWTALRRWEIGMIFQFFNLLPMLTAFENVALPLLLRGDPQREAKEKAAAALTEVGLSRRFDHLPSALSGGEMQRVAIARADAMSPQILLADEPTGNLDSRIGEEILTLLASRSKSAGVTLLLATHSAQAIPFADQIIHLKDGRVERIEERKSEPGAGG